MAKALRSAVAPLYLFACLILGGSAQGVWQNALLQLVGLAIIAWAAVIRAEEPLPRPAKWLLLLILVGVVVVLLQLVPLPPSLWAHGVRARLADGYRILGLALPALPLSVAPYESLDTLLTLVPPAALFLAVVRIRPARAGWLAVALIAGAVAGTLLGALQVASAGSSAGSSAAWYPYRQTNVGVAVGFFANANHMASLLVISLPFIAALAALARGRNIQRYSGLLAILAAVALVVVVGIALNGSLAGYSLALPVLAASALIVLPRPNRFRAWAVGLVALAGVAALGALASSAVDATRLDQQANTSVQSRAVILQTTTSAIGDFMPFGSGLGSFLRVYRLYESPDAVTNEYVIHAHNDYAELALELGVPGIILMLIFLGWWLTAVWAVCRRGEGGPFAQAATIASAALLVHSLVDFPLRTAAMSACFALCLGLLADRRAPRPKEPTDLRPTRHVVIS